VLNFVSLNIKLRQKSHYQLPYRSKLFKKNQGFNEKAKKYLFHVDEYYGKNSVIIKIWHEIKLQSPCHKQSFTAISLYSKILENGEEVKINIQAYHIAQRNISKILPKLLLQKFQATSCKGIL
jgi:hypothetical protein